MAQRSGYRMVSSDFGRDAMSRHKVSAVYNFEPSAYYDRLYPNIHNQTCNRRGPGDIRSVGLWDEAVDEPIAYPFVAQDSSVPGESLRSYGSSSTPRSDRLCYIPDWRVETTAPSNSKGNSLLPGSPYMTWSESSLKGFGGSAVLSTHAQESGKTEDDEESCSKMSCKWND